MSRNVVPAVRSNPTHEGVHSTTAGGAPNPQLSIVETELRQIATEATLNGFVKAGLIKDRTLARTMLVALEVKNVDEVLAQVYPDEKDIAAHGVKADLEEALQQLVSRAYQAGAADALKKLAEDSSKPISRTVKTVHEDARGHVTHITEEAFRT
jgi:hypothetical protein